MESAADRGWQPRRSDTAPRTTVGVRVRVDYPVVVNSFDERAATWEADEAKTAQTRQLGTLIERRIGLSPDWSVLEYGAGTGTLGRSLAHKVSTVVLVDASTGMVAEARRLIDSESLTNVEAMDAGCGPGDGFTCDLLVAAMMLHHVEDVDALLDTFSSYVRPGGWLAIADLDEDAEHTFHDADFTGHHGFDRADLTTRVTTAGFVDVTVEDAHHISRSDEGDSDHSVFLLTARRES